MPYATDMHWMNIGGRSVASELEDAIIAIREKISQKRAPFSKGQGKEKTVVDNIVRPILRSLGWNLGTNLMLHESEVELRKKKGRADIVLSKGHDNWVLAVEAKNLGEEVDGQTSGSEKHVEQLVEYLISLDRNFGILTNGEVWHLIRRNGFDWETVWIIDILKDDMPKLVESFKYISPENSDKLSARIELERRKQEVLGKEWVRIQQDRDAQLKLFVDLLHKQVESKYSDMSIKPAEVMDFLKGKYYGLSGPTETTDVTSIPISEGQSGPHWFSLDGKIHSITTMKESLLITAEWLIERGKLNLSTAPIESGKVRYLVANKPIHRNNRKFDAGMKLSNGLFIETNYDAVNYKRKVWELLEHFNYDRSLAIFSW